MMIETNSTKSSCQAKQEDDAAAGVTGKFSKTLPSTSSRQWTAFRNPRIVRVSRSLGGKDRHSKVCTVRGLRDRRIRLSVPTAIQLYDLQHRLGVGQPSKVIDWLLEATKLDIDKLPPLQIPQGFAQFHHQQTLIPLSHHHDPSLIASSSPFSLGGFYDGNSSRFWEMKGKESDTSNNGVFSEKGKWIKTNQEQHDDGDDDGNQEGLLLLNNAMGYNHNNNSNSSLDPSSLLTLSSSSSSSQFGSHVLLLDPHSSNFLQQFSSSSSTTTPSVFSSYCTPFTANNSSSSSLSTVVESNNSEAIRHFNHVQILSSQVMPHHHHYPFIPSSSLFNSIVSNNNSAAATIRRVSMPFSSKLLDSDDNNNNGGSNQQNHHHHK
ncbi:hypothetical protein PIB30_083850, partial [Stylosanthes scabra]|nr:hypothetical protein [Stylosanthes scabra]